MFYAVTMYARPTAYIVCASMLNFEQGGVYVVIAKLFLETVYIALKKTQRMHQ